MIVCLDANCIIHLVERRPILPDALHLAAAAEHGCALFLTNDAKLLRCSDITVELLS